MLSVKLNKRAVKVERDFPRLLKLFELGIRDGAYKAGDTVVRRVQNILNTGTRTGVKYPRLPNRSSAPGEPPRTQSGRLAKSAYYKVRGYHQIAVGERVKYAEGLEFGNSRIQPRPHLIVAIAKEERNVELYLQNEVFRRINI